MEIVKYIIIFQVFHQTTPYDVFYYFIITEDTCERYTVNSEIFVCIYFRVQWCCHFHTFDVS